MGVGVARFETAVVDQQLIAPLGHLMHAGSRSLRRSCATKVPVERRALHPIGMALPVLLPKELGVDSRSGQLFLHDIEVGFTLPGAILHDRIKLFHQHLVGRQTSCFFEGSGPACAPEHIVDAALRCAAQKSDLVHAELRFPQSQNVFDDRCFQFRAASRCFPIALQCLPLLNEFARTLRGNITSEGGQAGQTRWIPVNPEIHRSRSNFFGFP